MTSWEERMARRAAERTAAEPPPLTLFTDPASDHFGHHSHLRVAMVECSCGEFFGVTSVAVDDDFDESKLSCSVCGVPGVVDLGGDGL